MNVVQPDTGGGASSGGATSGAVTLSTSGGALGGLDTGNATLRVEPAAASFPSSPTEVVSLRDAHTPGRQPERNPHGDHVIRAAQLPGRRGCLAADRHEPHAHEIPGYNLAERSNDGNIAFNTTSPSEPLAALSGSGFSLSLRVPGLTGSGSQQGTNGLVFGAPGGDSKLVFRSTSDGFEFGAVLSRAGAPNTYSFAVETHGLTLRIAADGQTIEVLDGQGADQEVLGVIGAPALADAHGVVSPGERGQGDS